VLGCLFLLCFFGFFWCIFVLAIAVDINGFCFVGFVGFIELIGIRSKFFFCWVLFWWKPRAIGSDSV
jgi:hypothetical protein